MAGKFDSVNQEDITPKYPWYIDFQDTKISAAGTSMKQGGTITCVSFRNYITTWSDFNLAGNTQIRANFGFRVYPTSTSVNAVAKGYAENVMLFI